MDAGQLEARKARARTLPEALRDDICAAFEALEEDAPASLYGDGAARFVRTPWTRTDHSGAPGGGGVMSMLKGRLFEKVGVHASTVFGEFAPEFRVASRSGADTDPRFWASGISLIAHLWNPHAPAVHEHPLCRHHQGVVHGGSDLTPVLDARRTQDDPDTHAFHAAMKAACDAHATVASYDKYKKWCDEYFYLKHRQEMRGIGGIFYELSRRRLGRQSRLHAGCSPRASRISIQPGPPEFRDAVDRGRSRGAAHPPGPLCGVQPPLRPRHHVRPQDRR